MRLVIEDRVVNDEVGGAPLVIVATSGDIEIVARDRLQAEAFYDLGATFAPTG